MDAAGLCDVSLVNLSGEVRDENRMAVEGGGSGLTVEQGRVT